MGQSVGRGLDPSVGVYGRHGACPPPRGRGRACPARGFSRGWAAAEGFRGVGDAAPYAGGCPLTGSHANLRRGAGIPPYGCNSRKRGRGGHSLMGRSVGRGLDPSVGVYGRHGACPPPRGRGRACPARGFSRGWAAAEGFRGVGDAAPYAGGCPLTGSHANLRRGAGIPPYGCNSRKRGRGGHSLMGRSVGRGLDPSVGVYGRHGACPPPRGRGRACPARGFSRGWAAAEGFRGVGDAAPYVGDRPLMGCRANLRRGVGTPPYGCNSRKRGRGGLYAAREFIWDAVRRLLFFFQHWAGHTVENVSSLPGMDV